MFLVFKNFLLELTSNPQLFLKRDLINPNRLKTKQIHSYNRSLTETYARVTKAPTVSPKATIVKFDAVKNNIMMGVAVGIVIIIVIIVAFLLLIKRPLRKDLRRFINS